MKKTLLPLLLILSISASFAQKIHFTDSTNRWVYFYSWHSLIDDKGYEGENFIGTTTINGLLYNKLQRPGNSTVYYVREDTILNKVFIWDNNSGYDKVLYDYNWNVGDSITTTYWGTNPSKNFITSIDSTQIDGLWYKVWHFYSPQEYMDDYHFNVIEGIGCTSEFNFPHEPYYVVQLVCFSHNGISPPLSNPVFSYGTSSGHISFDNTTSCWPLSVNGIPDKNKELTIAPDPIDENSRIILPDKISSGSLSVVNGIGQVVFSTPFRDKEELPIGNRTNIPGIYFYHITDNETGKVYTGRFSHL